MTTAARSLPDAPLGGLRSVLEALDALPEAGPRRAWARVIGVHGALGPAVAAHVAARRAAPLLYVVPDEAAVPSRLAELSFFLGARDDAGREGETGWRAGRPPDRS